MKNDFYSTRRRESVIGSGDVSVDTVWLHFDATDYEVSDSPSLIVTPSLDGPDRFLWRTSTGKEVRGLSASYKGDEFYVRLRPFAGGSPWSCPPCLVSFSVPKLIYGHNLLPVTQEQLRLALLEIEQILKPIGISVDIWKATVCRFDLFRDIVLDFPVEYYIPLLSSLHVPYHLQGRTYPTSTFRSNKSRSVVFYDKDTETKRNFPHLHREYETPNLFRYEYRLRKASVVKSQLNRLRGMPQKAKLTAFDLVRDYHLISTYHAIEAERLFGNLKKLGESIDAFGAISQFQTDLGESKVRDHMETKQVESLVNRYGRKAYRQLTLLRGIEAALKADPQVDRRDVKLRQALKLKNQINSSGDNTHRIQTAELLPLAIAPCDIPCGVLLGELVKKFFSPNLALVTETERKDAPLLPNANIIDEITHSCSNQKAVVNM